MKLESTLGLVPIILAALILFSNYAYGDNPGQIGVKMIPGIIAQDTEGLVQVYSTSGGILDNLIVTSYDPSIVKITSVDQDKPHNLYLIKIKTLRAGDTSLGLAAPGFSSQEFPVSVTKNTNIVTKLLLKTTPSSFSTDGPKHGYFTVETVNENDLPTAVSSDTPISITSTDVNIVSLKNAEVVIPQGSYYAIGEFDGSQHGSAQISASSPTMQTVSNTVTISPVNSQGTLKVYVYPPAINAFQASAVYAIVQLQDSAGNPILAKDDIPVAIRVTNSSGTGTINTSGNTYYVQINETPVIKKGSYWASVPVELTAGTVNKFNVTASAKGFLSSVPANFTTYKNATLFDDKSAKIDTLPILATGGRELIGIAHLQDSKGNYVLAAQGTHIRVDSSDQSTVAVEDVAFDYGSESAPVYATIGNIVNPVTLHVVTAVPQTIVPTISSKNEDSITLVGEPLIQKVLTNSPFPLSLYVTKAGVSVYPKSAFDVQVSPTNVIEALPLSFTKDSSIKLTSATILQDGSNIISLTGSTAYSTSSTIDAVSSFAKSISLDYPDALASNVPSEFSVELLDAQKLPVYADHDITVKMISNDPSIIDFTDVQIKKGTYFTSFSAQAKKSGTADVSILADVIPLSKFTMNVVSYAPTVSIQSSDFSETGLPLVATITAINKQGPMAGLKVDWSADTATIKTMDAITNLDGIAKATFVSTNPGALHITAKVAGGSEADVTVTKDVTVNAPLSAAKESSQPQNSTTSFSIMGISPIFLIIPVVAGVIGFLFFKKREMFGGFTEKMDLGDEMTTLKERIRNLRQSD